MKNSFAKSLNFLIYVAEKLDINNLKIPSPTYDQGHIGHYSYFIVETSKEIQLLTLEWFTERACHTQQTILINSFIKSNKKWKEKLEIDEKFKNFHNCTLNVFSRIYNFEALYTLNLYDKQIKLHPFEVELVHAISVRGNFTPMFQWEINEKSLHIYYLTRINVINDDCEVTSHFWEDYITFNTSPAESYNSFEKVFLTFDTATWFYILGTFLCASLTICVVNKMPKNFQNLIFGENVKSPSMNVVGLFFGLGQTKLPKNNFARIILMSYMLFCIIIGTAYHG